MNSNYLLPFQYPPMLTADREFRHLRGTLLDHGAVVDAWPEEKLLGTEADCDLRKQLRNVVGNSCNERKLKSKVHDTMDCIY